MLPNADELKAHYSAMESHELLDRIQSGGLTLEAAQFAVAELASRGINPKDPRSWPTDESPPANSPPQKKLPFWAMALIIWVILGVVTGLHKLFKNVNSTVNSRSETSDGTKPMPLERADDGKSPRTKQSG